MMLKEKIKKCYDVKGNLSFKKCSDDLLDEIYSYTKFLDYYNAKLQERVYCIMNDITEIVRCPITNKKLKFSPQSKSYSHSKEFSRKNRIIKNPANFKQLNENKLLKIKNIYEKGEYNLITREKCIETYNKLTPTDNSRINSSIALNNLDFTCSVINHTNFLKFLDLNLSERIYCIENDINEMVKDSNGNLLKFINRKVGYSKYPTKQYMYDYLIDNAIKIVSNDYIVHGTIKETDSGTTKRLDLTCKKCNFRFSPFFKNGLWKDIYCPGCYGEANRSKMEEDCCQFLVEIGVINLVKNDRTILSGKELDIYLPDYNIAIELCGILWHSYGLDYPNNVLTEKDTKHKHREKYDNCKLKNIKLITIFENEWNLKRDIVKSIIKNKLGISDYKIYARKCRFDSVDKNIANKFLEKNHIQGKCQYSNAYGLFYENELVSLMCFGKRKITRGEVKLELIRFCNKLNTSVVGGASKIIKNCRLNSFISYCDLRYSSGDLYQKLGMRLVNTTSPNYFYTKDKINLHHRTNFQKHKIAKEGDTRTEKEIMYSEGYRRIYDCGNLVFEYHNTKY